MADILLDKVETFCRVCDEEFDLLRLTLLLGYDSELHLEVFAKACESWNGFESRWLDNGLDSLSHIWNPEELAVDCAEDQSVVRAVKLGIGYVQVVVWVDCIVLQHHLLLELLLDNVNDEKFAINRHQDQVLVRVEC